MFCTCLTLYQEDILDTGNCNLHALSSEKEKNQNCFLLIFFVADMPAPYRRGRLKKRNLISSIKKRFTGETLRQQPQNKKRCFFAFSCNTLAKDLVFFNFSKGNLVVVGTRSLSSGLDPNEKSQGYLSNTNGDSRHTSNILDSSQPSKHSKINTLVS